MVEGLTGADLPSRCGGAQTSQAVRAHHPHPHTLINWIGNFMNLHLSLTPLISLVAGILILVMPRLLNYIVAIYLIAIGLIGLVGGGSMRI